MENNKFALLIDSDNISAKYISGILDEMIKYGVITYKRIYGDWTAPYASKWKPELLSNSITPIQQFSNITGKNSTDSALIIDAMDILYTGSVDGFCIVSSDSDFTRLASRLRESGMTVIGMGEEKTPRSFRAACTIFTTLEVLIDNDSTSDDAQIQPLLENDSSQHTSSSRASEESLEYQSLDSSDSPGILSRQEIENTIISVINENENKEKMTCLSEIGNRLVNKHPDFDVRNYGYSSLSKFLEEDLRFELEKVNNTLTIKQKYSMNSRAEISSYIYALVSRRAPKNSSISDLSNQVHSEYPTFNVKDFGYSQFSKFVQSIDGIEVFEDRFKRKKARKATDEE